MSYYGNDKFENDKSGKDRLEKDKFERFRFFVIPTNTSGAVDIPVSSNSSSPTILASLCMHADKDDVVWLNASVGWQGTGGIPDVLFKIWRNAPVTGTLVASALQGCETNEERYYIASFSHVDTNFTRSRGILYFLTAEVINAPTGSASVIGPLTFTATEIEQG